MRRIYLVAIIAAVTVTSVTTDEFANIPTTCPVPDGENATHIAHETDCHKFYKCHMGKKTEITCPNSLCFNAELQVCDYAWNVSCCAGGNLPTTQPRPTQPRPTQPPPTQPPPTQPPPTQPPPTQPPPTQPPPTQPPPTQPPPTQPPPTQPPPTQPPPTQPPPTQPPPTQPRPTQPPPTQPPPTDDDDCGKLKNGDRVKHETDCRKYYECKAGRRTGPFDCLENQYFNPITRKCDVASNVPPSCIQ